MDINKIINLYRMFPKYQNNSYHELYYHVIPSIQLNQFKIFEDEDGVYGFVNWAYLNKSTEQTYQQYSKIYKNEWNNGFNLWLYDIIISRKPREVMSWVYNYFKKKLKTNESINWLRLDSKDKIYRVSKKYKREFHN